MVSKRNQAAFSIEKPDFVRSNQQMFFYALRNSLFRHAYIRKGQLSNENCPFFEYKHCKKHLGNLLLSPANPHAPILVRFTAEKLCL